MITFWVVAVSLTVAVVALLALPLARRRRIAVGVDPDRSNVELFQDQLSELERDREQGLLSDEQFEQARIELSQRLLADVPTPPEGKAANQAGERGSWRYAALACVPLAAVLGYLALGTPEAIDAKLAAGRGGMPADHQQSLAALTDRLAKRLESNPSDADAWVLLARSYQMLGRAPEAMKALARAVELVPNSAALYADYADMQVMAAGGKWTPEATAAVNKALTIDPTHTKALWLAGSEAYARSDYPVALRHWEQLAKVAEPGSEVAGIISNNIAEVRARMGQAPPPAPASSQPASGQPAAIDTPAADAGKTALSGVVALDPKLVSAVKASDTVFVFARAAQGPKIPLAMRRLSVKDLPYKFFLDDSSAMAPGMAISKFEQVVVGARVSPSGNAVPRPGDLEGFSVPVKPGTEGIQVRIDARVE